MKQQTLGRKPQNTFKRVMNVETSLTIKKGAPVVLETGSAGAGKLGFAVKSISNLAAAEQGLFFGIAMQDIPAGSEGDVVFGYYDYARVVRQSRAATSDDWASSTAIAVGDVLAMLTASSTASGGPVQGFSRSAAGSAFTNRHQVIAAETVASITTMASTLTAAQAGGGLYSTAYTKVFIVTS